MNTHIHILSVANPANPPFFRRKLEETHMDIRREPRQRIGLVFLQLKKTSIHKYKVYTNPAL